jgi:cell division protein FtsQ
MASSIVSVSQVELAQRRRQLRRRRRIRLLQSSWRVLAVCGLAGGLIWVITSPTWVLRRPEQVTIEGNQFVRTERVRSLLPLRYPQSLLKLEPQAVATGLKAKMPLTEVTVNRQLFPPGLTVQIAERQPVAIALLRAEATETSRTDADQSEVEAGTIAKPIAAHRGVLDEYGNWIPLERYLAVDQSLKLPTLKVLGNPEQYRLAWAKFYQEVSRSPIKILEIDWRDPTNLILKTELGIVYFGPYSPQFGYQLNLLDKLRHLPSQAGSDNLAYIDLRNPAMPTVQQDKI